MNIITERQAIQAIQEGAKLRTHYKIDDEGNYLVDHVHHIALLMARKYITKSYNRASLWAQHSKSSDYKQANKYATMATLVLYGAKYSTPLEPLDEAPYDDARDLATKAYNYYSTHYDHDGNKIK